MRIVLLYVLLIILLRSLTHTFVWSGLLFVDPVIGTSEEPKQ